MTAGHPVQGVRAVLLDIEGTTTPISFVHEVLFPYARARMPAFIKTRWQSPEMRAITDQLVAEHEDEPSSDETGATLPPWPSLGAPSDADISAYAMWLLDQDRKSPGLKELQGLIWERGYQAGELRGQVFPDVPLAIRSWRAAGLVIAIYSSGSVLAQRRLFESTEAGDLTPLMSGFFDTAVGPKTSAESYKRIAGRLARPPQQLLFVSDSPAELAAASDAGLQAVLSVRPGNPDQPVKAEWPIIHSFDELGL